MLFQLATLLSIVAVAVTAPIEILARPDQAPTIQICDSNEADLFGGPGNIPDSGQPVLCSADDLSSQMTQYFSARTTRKPYVIPDPTASDESTSPERSVKLCQSTGGYSQSRPNRFWPLASGHDAGVKRGERRRTGTGKIGKRFGTAVGAGGFFFVNFTHNSALKNRLQLTKGSIDE
ncbi:hypothetical protein B0H19DRAFT_1083507 [Mycena capillaripes]|nr:hypothetical protein B0H19DRAFT_1083507 [Mycena capillaripes]